MPEFPEFLFYKKFGHIGIWESGIWENESIQANKLLLDFYKLFFPRILNDLKELTLDNVKENSMLLMSLLITCCDLSDQVRPWPTTQNVAVKNCYIFTIN